MILMRIITRKTEGDRIDNIQTAQELGFKTHHITPQHGIIDYFAGYL